MANWLRISSRTVANHIKKRMNKGFMGGAVHVNQSSGLWWGLNRGGPVSDRNGRHIDPLAWNRATFLCVQRFKSTLAEKQHDSFLSSDSDDDNQSVDFPGGKVSYTSEMSFISESSQTRVPCYRVLDDDGDLISDCDFQQVSKEVAVKMYSNMVTLQIMDNIFYEAQRQGRISFYLTSAGEEAISIASAAALSEQDIILPQYREPGVLLWRGFTLQEFADQCFGNKADYGKGRQMPIHYGSKSTISSPFRLPLQHNFPKLQA
ncbi:hypothetical protein ERO13_A05G240400v2 [Gossypium hirsutum]|nr:hypothetical protein ERO13_A05G240400v2 [Gossypium hirsutum]